MQGSMDVDLRYFPGYMTYDRTHAPDLAAPLTPPPGCKALMWIHKGCHSYFNTKWDYGLEGLYGFDMRDYDRLIKPDEQRQLTKGYIAAFAEGVIRGDSPTLEALKIVFGDPGSAPWNPAGVVATCQYQDQNRLFIQHFQEGDPPVISAPTMGASVTIGADLTTKVRQFDDGMNGMGLLYQDTQGLRVEWSLPRTTERSYVVTLPAGSVDYTPYTHFALRINLSTEPENPTSEPLSTQGYYVVVSDGTKTARIANGGLHDFVRPSGPDYLLYVTPPLPTAVRRVVMQTCRISLFSLSYDYGINFTNDITFALEFSVLDTGVFYIDDIQLTS